MNYNFKEIIHILFVFDDEIDISVAQLESQTLPSVERDFFWLVLLNVVGIHMLSKHPESRWNATKKDAFDIIKVATGRALVKIKHPISDIILHLLFN